MTEHEYRRASTKIIHAPVEEAKERLDAFVKAINPYICAMGQSESTHADGSTTVTYTLIYK